MSNDKIFEYIKENHKNFTNIPEEFKCVICNLLIVNAVGATCGCLYCKECAAKYFLDDICCPGYSKDCVETKPKNNTSLNHRTNKLIENIEVECCWKNCNYNKSLKYIIKHVEECEERIVTCTYEEFGCFEKIIQKDLKNHMDDYAKEHQTMLLNSNVLLKDELEKVKEELKNLKSINENMEIKLCSKKEQILKLTDERDLCEDMIKILNAKEDRKEDCKLLEEKLEKLENDSKMLKTLMPTKNSYIWKTYKPFISKKERVIIISDWFTLTEMQYSMRLILYPNGSCEEYNRFVSVYFEILMKADSPLVLYVDLSLMDDDTLEPQRSFVFKVEKPDNNNFDYLIRKGQDMFCECSIFFDNCCLMCSIIV